MAVSRASSAFPPLLPPKASALLFAIPRFELELEVPPLESSILSLVHWKSPSQNANAGSEPPALELTTHPDNPCDQMREPIFCVLMGTMPQ